MSYPFRHASFDVWNTLITANPEYAAARTDWLAHQLVIPREAAKFIYTHVKQYADSMAELHGRQIGTEHLYTLLGNHGIPNIPHTFAEEAQETFAELFSKYPPVFDPRLVNLLKQLEADGVTISLGSNTNFISGKIMRKVVFDPLQIPFAFKLFSDEVRCAKPNPHFYGTMFCNAQFAHETISPEQILHVGDSIKCDVHGATQASMRAIHVQNPQALIDLLLRMKHLYA